MNYSKLDVKIENQEQRKVIRKKNWNILKAAIAFLLFCKTLALVGRVAFLWNSSHKIYLCNSKGEKKMMLSSQFLLNIRPCKQHSIDWYGTIYSLSWRCFSQDQIETIASLLWDRVSHLKNGLFAFSLFESPGGKSLCKLNIIQKLLMDI